MIFPSGLRALNHPDYRRFFLAQMVALVSGWMHTVAQSWLVLQLTDSPLRLGLIGTLQFGPILLFSIVTGAIADRLPKRENCWSWRTWSSFACMLTGISPISSSKSVPLSHC